MSEREEDDWEVGGMPFASYGGDEQVFIEKPDGTIDVVRTGVWVKLHVTFRDRLLKKLKGSRLSVFLCIGLHINAKNECFPTIKTISAETGYSEREIKDAVQELEDLGLLTVRRKRRTNNVYCVNRMFAYGKEGGAPLGEVSAPKKHASNCTQEVLQTAPQEEPSQVEPTSVPSAKSAEGHNESAEVVPPVEPVNLAPHTYHMPEGYSSKKQREHQQPCMERCGGHLGIADDTCPQCGWPAAWKGSAVYDARLKKVKQDAEAKQDPVIVEIGRLGMTHFPQSEPLNLHALKIGVWSKRVECHDEDGQGLLALARRMATGKYSTAGAYLAHVRNTYHLYGPDLPKASPYHLESPFSATDADTANLL